MIEDSRQALLTGDLSHIQADIIGLGMHGSWTAIALARLGLDSLRLWDGDTVERGNLQTQAYTALDLERLKSEALADALSARGVTPHGHWDGEPLHPVVICCADSMEVRRSAAQTAPGLFIESRSAGNTLFVHAFKTSPEKVQRYLRRCFPRRLASVRCGETGTAAIGMQVAALIASLVMQSRGGELPELILEDHEITLGLSHIVRPTL